MDLAGACTHVQALETLTYPKQHACEDCLQSNGRWVSLRTCQTCGGTRCCDSSPNRHSTKHAKSAHHPVIASAEPGERWLYCFVDDDTIEY